MTGSKRNKGGSQGQRSNPDPERAPGDIEENRNRDQWDDDLDDLDDLDNMNNRNNYDEYSEFEKHGDNINKVGESYAEDSSPSPKHHGKLRTTKSGMRKNTIRAQRIEAWKEKR